jgi:hypothetical protein
MGTLTGRWVTFEMLLSPRSDKWVTFFTKIPSLVVVRDAEFILRGLSLVGNIFQFGSNYELFPSNYILYSKELELPPLLVPTTSFFPPTIHLPPRSWNYRKWVTFWAESHLLAVVRDAEFCLGGLSDGPHWNIRSGG